MSRRLFIPAMLAFLLALLFATAAAAAQPSPGNRPQAADGGSRAVPGTAQPTADTAAPFVKGQAIVQFRAGVSGTARSAAAARASARVQRVIPRCWAKDGSTLAVVRSSTSSTAELIAELSADPAVAYAEPDYIVHAEALPNDPYWNSLWGMPRISAPSAWNVSTGSTGVVIADIDTGVDYTHPDLAANMWHNPGEIAGNGIDDDGNGYIDDVYGIDAVNNDSNPMDDHGHGSHTSGTAAGVGNNTTGVTGVCWTARIMALKFLDAEGSGPTSDAIECINYVVWQKNHGINVVVMNNSWGGGSYSESLRAAINAAGAAGIVFVASAGNGGADGVGDNNDTTPSYPASYDCANIIAVSASMRNDALAGFSNYGATSVDLAAPGVSTLSTVPASLYDPAYASWQGTSMAAPHVTGAVALCATAFPGDTMAQRRTRILNNVDAVGSLAGTCATGGRLNVAKAVGVTPSDDDIPGVPLPASAVAGTLTQTTDMNDVYSVFLREGDSFTASVSGAAGSNFNLYLFTPAAATVSNKTIAVASATGATYPDAFTYSAPATGTYYLDLYAAGGSGAYSLTWSIAVAGDDNIPGVAAPPSPINGTLDAAIDGDDVFGVNLSRGQVVTASISGPAGSNFCLLLYHPSATDIFADDYLIGATQGAYPRTLSYQALVTGTYYFDAWAYSGVGAYTVTYSISPAAVDDDIPGVPLTASPVAGTVGAADRADVFRFSAATGQSLQFSVNGAAGTDFDLYLFGPTATSWSTSSYLAVASNTSYPDSLSYSATTAGTYYIVVWAYGGSGAYTMTHNIPVDVTPPTTTLLGHTATGWVNHDVQLTLQAGDDSSGVARIEYMLGAGAWTTYGAPVVVSAEGETLFGYRAIDNAGNTEAAKSATVRIDKTGPTTTASNKVSVKKNKKATFRFKVADRTGTAKVTIKIFKGRKLKKSLTVGSKPCGSPQSYSWKRCALAKGSYTWKVYATDEAGNVQIKVGSKGLTVK